MVLTKVASAQQEQGLNSTVPQFTDDLQIRHNMDTGALSTTPANEGVVAIQILVMHSRMVRVPGARSDLIGLLGLAGPVRRGSATIIRR